MSFCELLCLLLSLLSFLFASSSDCARGFAFTGLLHQSPVSSGYLLVPVLIAGASVSLKVRSSALSSQSFGELLQGKGFSIPSSQLLLRWAMDLKPWVQIFSFSPFASSYCKLKITFMGSSVAFWLSYSNPESKIDLRSEKNEVLFFDLRVKNEPKSMIWTQKPPFFYLIYRARWDKSSSKSSVDA